MLRAEIAENGKDSGGVVPTDQPPIHLAGLCPLPPTSPTTERARTLKTDLYPYILYRRGFGVYPEQA